MTREELIARLEAASGPDRELDGEIYQLASPIIANCWSHWTRQQREELTPAYTVSLDEALTLVPDGMCYELDTFPTDQVSAPFMAFIAMPTDAFVAWTEGASMPLAICIAAIKARQP